MPLTRNRGPAAPPPLAAGTPASAPAAAATEAVPLTATANGNAVSRVGRNAFDQIGTAAGTVVACIILFGVLGLVFGPAVRDHQWLQNMLLGALIGLLVGLAILFVGTFGEEDEVVARAAASAAASAIAAAHTQDAAAVTPAAASPPAVPVEGTMDLRISVQGPGVPNAAGQCTVNVS